MSARVFLVDDQALVRAGFRMLIEAQPDMEVVGEADDGRTALEALAVTRADVVLMDVRMPGVDGVAGNRAAARRSPADPPKVIVLTTFDLDEYVFAAIRAGASGFLLKDARPEELLGAVRAVIGGDAVVAPERDAPPARSPRRCAAGRSGGGSAAGGADPAGARGAGGDRPRALERRDRRRPLHGRGDGQDPRRAAAGEARAARPCAACGTRVRDRARARRSLIRLRSYAARYRGRM